MVMRVLAVPVVMVVVMVMRAVRMVTVVVRVRMLMPVVMQVAMSMVVPLGMVVMSGLVGGVAASADGAHQSTSMDLIRSASPPVTWIWWEPQAGQGS